MEIIENEQNHSFHPEILDVINAHHILDEKVQNQPASPASQPSIDFSAATPDSKTDNNFVSDQLPFSDLLNDHDTFDLNESLDIFSNGGHMDDENSISDISDDGQPKRSQKKNKHGKLHKKSIVKEKNEENVEIRKVSVVETEIDVVKKLENGPSAAELRRRNLIEIDQDELEERVEKLNKITLQVMTKSLGLSKTEQLQRIIECRLFLKQYWDDSELGDFIEETVDKMNSRIYGADAAPAVEAMDYLDRESYSDDDWLDELEVEELEDTKPVIPTAVKEDDKQVDVCVGSAGEVKEGLIVLEESEDEEDELDIVDNTNIASSPNAVSGIVATAVVTPAEAAARARLAELERQRVSAAARESAEIERRKQLFLAANKAPKNSRAALLTALRQKVHQTAKENYCNQRKIHSEHLSLKLQIAEKCRQLVELLKERHETRVSVKREARKAKYQQQADADEEEFDENDSEFLGEGQFLTAEEKEALLRGGDSSSEEEEVEDAEGLDEGEEERLPPLDEERMNMNAAFPRENVDPTDSDCDADKAKTEEQDASTPPEQSAANDVVEQDEEEMEMKIAHIRQNHTGGESNDGIRRYGSVRVERTPRAGEGVATEEKNSEMDIDADSVADTVPGSMTLRGEETSAVDVHNVCSEQKAGDAESVAGQTTASAYTQKSSRHKKKATGNTLYRLALEEEERRSRRKGNALLEDEAAEDEEEGLQAGLGDFGFGVTSNIRERDEEVNALKMQKGDFDHIVDEVSDGEGDEAAGAVARAEMELQEDRARDRAIITAVTEGHDAMRKMQKKGKYTFDKLVGEDVGSSSRRGGAEVETEEYAEEEFDEEEMLQRGFKDRFDREYQSRARRGRTGDSDSDSAGESDTDENLLEQLDTSDMTEEQKAEEMERIQRLREKNRQDALMAKQRIQSYKMARERARHEKIQRQIQQQQQASAQGGVGAMSLMRQDSMGSRPALSLSLTLEPLHDQYSRLLMSNEATSTLVASSSNSNLVAPVSAPGISPRDPSSSVSSSKSVSHGKLSDITNIPHQQIKRRTAQAPKHAAVVGDKRTMRRSHTMDSTRNGKPKDGPGGLYRSELNRQEVEEGFGMGMALPSSARNSTHNKMDVSGGLFSAVTGLRRFGDLGKSATNIGSGSNSLRKRTFSEVGKLHSTVAAQQFVFAGVDESSQQFSRQGDNSTSGFGASRSASVTAGSSRPRLQSSSAGSSVPSLFAQLGAKRGASQKASSNK